MIDSIMLVIQEPKLKSFLRESITQKNEQDGIKTRRVLKEAFGYQQVLLHFHKDTKNQDDQYEKAQKSPVESDYKSLEK